MLMWPAMKYSLTPPDLKGATMTQYKRGFEQFNVNIYNIYVSRRRRGEGLVHAALDRQLDVVSVNRRLFGVSRVDFSVFDNSRHVS